MTITKIKAIATDQQNPVGSTKMAMYSLPTLCHLSMLFLRLDGSEQTCEVLIDHVAHNNSPERHLQKGATNRSYHQCGGPNLVAPTWWLVGVSETELGKEASLLLFGKRNIAGATEFATKLDRRSITAIKQARK